MSDYNYEVKFSVRLKNDNEDQLSESLLHLERNLHEYNLQEIPMC